MKLLASIALLAYMAVSNAESFYAYTCDNCDCDAYLSFEATNICIDIGSGAASLGISTELWAKTHCTIFSEEDCAGSSQNVGHHTDDTWGCTNSQIGWVKSVKCFD